MQRVRRGLRIAGLVYSVLYALFLVAGAIPATRPAIFSHPDLPSFRLEASLTFLLFALFLAGLVIWKHSELGAGLVFLIWYALVFWMDLFSTRYGQGGGAGPVIGIPGLLIGVILVAVWVGDRVRSGLSPASSEHN